MHKQYSTHWQRQISDTSCTTCLTSPQNTSNDLQLKHVKCKRGWAMWRWVGGTHVDEDMHVTVGWGYLCGWGHACDGGWWVVSTCVDEDVSAQVIGAPKGGVAVLTDVGLGAWWQTASICIQQHWLLKDERRKKTGSVSFILSPRWTFGNNY